MWVKYGYGSIYCGSVVARAYLFTVFCELGKGRCLGWWRLLFQLYLMYSILLKSVVYGHGRGTHLGTCLVYAACVVVFVAYMNGDKFALMCLILFQSVVHGHGRGTRLGTCLLYATCVVAFVA